MICHSTKAQRKKTFGLKTVEMASRQICTICSKHLKKPKILPCFHSFCLVCLENLYAQNTLDMTCPTCSKPVNVPSGGVKMFVDNIYIDDECTESYCEKHHREIIKLVCKDCKDELLCLVCKSTKHDNHRCVDIATEAEGKRRIVFEKLEKTDKCLKDTISKSGEICSAEKNAYKSVVAEIQKCKDSLNNIKEQIDIFEKSFDAEIKNFTNQYESNRKLSMENREIQIKKFRKSIEKCRSQLEKDDNATFLIVYKDMMTSLSDVYPLECTQTDISHVRALVSMYKKWFQDLNVTINKTKPEPRNIQYRDRSHSFSQSGRMSRSRTTWYVESELESSQL